MDLIHGFLSSEAYRSRGIPRGTVERAIAGSLGLGTPAFPQSLMEILRPDIYRSAAADIPALQ